MSDVPTSNSAKRTAASESEGSSPSSSKQRLSFHFPLWNRSQEEAPLHSVARPSAEKVSTTISADGERQNGAGNLPSSSIIGHPAPSSKRSSCCEGFGKPSTEKWEDHDHLNRVIVKELNDLSLEDREKLFDDIHGVYHNAVEETDEWLNVKLEKMKKSTNSIPSKPAYNRSKFLTPSSVEDRKLRLMMLRAENYDTTEAAKRFAAYFEFKASLFGMENLSRPITQDRLTEPMRRRLRSGIYQISKGTDRSGRTVIFFLNDSPMGDWRAHLGMCWYIQMKALEEDVEIQKRGFVAVMFTTPSAASSFEALQKSQLFSAAFPYRLAAFHVCVADSSMKSSIRFFQSNLSKFLRLQTRVHFGSFTELSYQLLSFGITPDLLAQEESSDSHLRDWYRRLDEMQAAERAIESESKVIWPTHFDVVLGRGHPYQTMSGNKFLADIIGRNREKYEHTPRAQKTAISLAILQYTKSVGGRFLRRRPDADDLPTSGFPADGYWIIVDDSEARAKISHGFRSPFRRDSNCSNTPGKNFTAHGITISIPPTPDIYAV